jgi:hypothetical protein
MNLEEMEVALDASQKEIKRLQTRISKLEKNTDQG